jgi:hypothetical protein
MSPRRLTRMIRNHWDTVTIPTLSPEGVSVDFQSLPHACGGAWQWDAVSGQHRIAISNKLGTANTRGGSLLNFYRAVSNHETAHALFTERDSSAFLRVGPPYLANLFEDARIESAWRKSRDKATGKKRKRFAWMQFQLLETAELGHYDPISFFIDYIVADGSAVIHRSILDHASLKGYRDLAEDVRAFYMRAIKAPDSAALAPIIQDWLDKYGVAPSPSGGVHSGTASASGSGSGGCAGTPAPAAPSASKAGGGGKGAHIPAPPDRSHCKSAHYAASKGGGTWKDTPKNKLKVQRVLNSMEAAFRIGEQVRFTQSPKGRMSIRHVISNLPDIYRDSRKVGSDAPMNIRAIVDTSGSMTETTSKEIGGFIEALCTMHQNGRIKLDLWLSGNGGNSHIENPRPEDAHYIYTGGGDEFIHGTMKASDKFKPAKEYDAVIVITDGQITDGSVTAECFSGQDNTLCVYVPDHIPCDAGILTRMNEQFPHAICRNDSESLADAVAGELSSWRASGLMEVRG